MLGHPPALELVQRVRAGRARRCAAARRRMRPGGRCRPASWSAANVSHQRRRQDAAEVADDRLDGAHGSCAGAARRSGRRPVRPSIRQRKNAQCEAQAAEVERRAAADLARGAARERPPRRRTARARRGAGGRRRRTWSTAAASSDRDRARLGLRRRGRGSSRRPAPRRGAARRPGGSRSSDTARPSSSHAPTVRASAIRSQSGAPHECPRWPRQSTATRCPPRRDASRSRGTAWS